MLIHGNQIALQSITWVHTADVRTEGTLQPLHVFAIAEVVVAVLICAKLRVVMLGSEHQRGAAAPSPDHLGCQQLFILGTC